MYFSAASSFAFWGLPILVLLVVSFFLVRFYGSKRASAQRPASSRVRHQLAYLERRILYLLLGTCAFPLFLLTLIIAVVGHYGRNELSSSKLGVMATFGLATLATIIATLGLFLVQRSREERRILLRASEQQKV